MAEKRITTVDEIMTVDEDADFVMVLRGVQQDLKRLLLRRLPTRFDLHDDVADQLTGLAGADRLLITDESAAGDPQMYVRLSTLRTYLLDLFDLHDDVPTELTAAADADRLLISDESAAGDPQKWISVEHLSAAISRSWADTTERAIDDVYTGLPHSLGITPTRYKIDLVCKISSQGWSVGDLLLNYSEERLTFVLHNTTQNVYSMISSISFSTLSLPHKTTGDLAAISHSNWRFLVTLY